MIRKQMTPLEINKRIAELKGIKLVENHFCDNVDSCVFEIDHESTKEMGYEFHIFYSWAEFIDQAWSLFEEMANEGWTIGKSPDGWFVGKIKPGEIYRTYDTAPMAICMAWIQWKEGE